MGDSGAEMRKSSSNDYVKIHDEVQDALADGRAVVALESTIISHGMPWPDNVSTARQVEQIVRDRGAVPATIAILDGKLTVGLNSAELERLGKSDDIVKVSRRDLPYVTARRMNGATTVAATMIVSELAGIEVFVTGGIGGVHRGAGETFDISADLQELAKTSVAVVCAGAKSILDIGLTLEYLETFGIPVIGFGTSRFPAFFNRDSGFSLDFSVESAEEAADIWKAKRDLGLDGGMIVANPVPSRFEMEKGVIDTAIEEALGEMNRKNITGKETTPFLLDAIQKITGKESLKTNIELVFNNARVGADIAAALSEKRDG